MKLFLSYIIGMFIVLSGYAQTYTISGYIQDAATAEKLIGAGIYDKKHRLGTLANTYGFYSLSLPNDSVVLIINYVGYNEKQIKFYLDKNIQMNIDLQSLLELKEIEIIAEKSEKIEQSTQMSTVNIPIQQIKAIPALLGEVDVLKVIQLLPGVQSAEGTSGFYVRGGGADQNLILLDGTPVYNASHLFGFFSIFNADAINNIEFIKGGFPARYGGRLSSVLEINMKEGNLNEFHTAGSIGIISSKLMVEGPIKKDKSSFIISGRRTYIDLIVQPLMKVISSSYEEIGYYFYDVNAKLNYKLGDYDRIYFSVYTGKDKFHYTSQPFSLSENGNTYTYENTMGLGWGNVTSAFRWNHQYSSKLFGNTTLTYSRYKFYVDREDAEQFENDTLNYTNLYKLK
jgi:outer membrane cobalamin receptor